MANGHHQVDGNQLTLLQNGAVYFPQLCADIDAAQSFIYLEAYIFSDDETAYKVSEALQRAARRGVVVRVLMDGFGSARFPSRWMDEWRAAGVEAQWFRRKISPFTLRRNRLRRLHRKLVVLDGEVAFIGGINIIDDATGNKDAGAPRFDFAVRVQGSVAGEIHMAMRRMWSAVSWASQHLRGKRIERFILDAARSTIQSNISLLLRDNLRHRRDIERAYLKAIAGAQHEVVIANAYFLPGRIFRRALIQAAQRGVRVVLLLQGRVEHRLLHYATHALYQQLLAAGIEIYEYQAGYLHAKVAVVDGVWATVGSSNIDPFSLLLAREANLAVMDAGFATELRDKLLMAVLNDALRIELSHWNQQSAWVHGVSRLSYAVVRMMVGMLGYGRRVD
ncbi:MAG: cardiolipin synthase ClsB [Gallionella sp.]|nr:cardiolipin synthase ClsB [Gallionella sp.]MDP1940231.1 cardiolipin synthase ClsB [Gallionella sp.]